MRWIERLLAGPLERLYDGGDMNYYIYKCVVDDGKAPCVDRGLLSLCICKPMIRSAAVVDDVIFAFGSNSESPANRLIYIARVTRKLTDGEYYELEQYRHRSDCIYERARDGRFKLRSSATVHLAPSALEHDLGKAPNYARANSLVSSDFRYFGAQGTADWKSRAPVLTRLVESLEQGHRVKLSLTLRDELSALKRSIWRKHRRKILGKPLHLPDRHRLPDEPGQHVKVCRERCYIVKSKC